MSEAPSSDDKLMAAICYWGSTVLSFIPALVIFFIKKEESAFIRKHAIQAMLAALASWLIISVASTLTFFLLGVGGLLAWLVFIVFFIIWGIKAFQGEDVSIPLITDMVEKNMQGSE